MTIADHDGGSTYINTPLFKCPITGCSFTSHLTSNMREHLRGSHKKMYETVMGLSPLHRYLYLLKESRQMTFENIIHRGEAKQCNICGWCTTSNKNASKHPAQNHRDRKTEDTVFIKDVLLKYDTYERDGSSISPFIGSKFEQSKK